MAPSSAEQLASGWIRRMIGEVYSAQMDGQDIDIKNNGEEDERGRSCKNVPALEAAATKKKKDQWKISWRMMINIGGIWRGGRRGGGLVV